MPVERSPTHRRRRPGFTLVEMLVVITIIGMLAGLILPAVQGAREASRLSQCRNNVGQLTKGLLHHETSKGFFPSGGWGPAWLGIADRHSDSSQPGSWIFGIMPYIEEETTKNIVANLTVANCVAQYQALAATPIPMLTCPSRRTTLPVTPKTVAHYASPAPSVSIQLATRSDYAANAGSAGSCAAASGFKGIPANAITNAIAVTVCPGGSSLPIPQVAAAAGVTHAGPCSDCGKALEDDASLNIRSQFATLAAGDGWRRDSIVGRFSTASDPRLVLPDLQDGVVYRMSRVQDASISDGLSNVYLIGEKYVAADRYEADGSNADSGDDGPLVAGYSSNTIRSGFEPPSRDAAGVSHPTAFGSSHAAGWNAAFGDGSVRTLAYSIDPALHRQLSARADGAGAPPAD